MLPHCVLNCYKEFYVQLVQMHMYSWWFLSGRYWHNSYPVWLKLFTFFCIQNTEGEINQSAAFAGFSPPHPQCVSHHYPSFLKKEKLILLGTRKMNSLYMPLFLWLTQVYTQHFGLFANPPNCPRRLGVCWDCLRNDFLVWRASWSHSASRVLMSAALFCCFEQGHSLACLTCLCLEESE